MFGIAISADDDPSLRITACHALFACRFCSGLMIESLLIWTQVAYGSKTMLYRVCWLIFFAERKGKTAGRGDLCATKLCKLGGRCSYIPSFFAYTHDIDQLEWPFLGADRAVRLRQLHKSDHTSYLSLHSEVTATQLYTNYRDFIMSVLILLELI